MGFSTGFVVVVYTHAAEKGDEQKCLRVFKDAQLADISFCAATGLLAACGGSTFVIVDLVSWKVIKAETLDKSLGSIDSVCWSSDGKVLSMSSTAGCLLTFRTSDPDHIESADTSSLVPHVLASQRIPPIELIGSFIAATWAIILCLSRALHVNSVSDLVAAALGNGPAI